MSDYTPDVVLVRLAYTAGLIDLNSDESRESQVTKHRAEVDRFVARTRAEALRSAADTLEHMSTSTLGDGSSEEWVRVRDLHARADLIEEGEL